MILIGSIQNLRVLKGTSKNEEIEENYYHSQLKYLLIELTISALNCSFIIGSIVYLLCNIK